MNREIEGRFLNIFTAGEMARLSFTDKDGQLFITADVHGLTCRQAKRFLNNIILLVRKAFTLVVIHGYVHGTAIKKMILGTPINKRIISKSGLAWNYGVTLLECA